VMGRRKVAFAPAYDALLREVFAMTRGSRAEIVPARLPRGRARASAAAADEAQLARAEADAIQAFGPVGTVTR
ncbi:MAG TPA: hypothetical protein VF897_13800, partial [Roseiflexaceae bacterium]